MGRLFNLSLQHRRMHNKLWLADNSVAIVGGRRSGDEYFDAEPNLNFTDIDMLSVGPVAEQLGHSFDQYWNSALSKPIDDFVSKQPLQRRPGRRARAPGGVVGRVAPAESRAVQPPARLPDPTAHGHLASRVDLGLESGVVDAPSKALSKADPDPRLLLTTQLAPELEGVNQELIMISAYFVPGQPGLVYLTGRADAGVSVSLLTNSLEATDVPAVHGGYAPYRKALLEHGVKLYELRRQPGDGGGSGPHLFRRAPSEVRIPACTARQ